MVIKMDKIRQDMLVKIAELHEIPTGAYNIRADGETFSRNSTENIEIVTKEDKQGIDIIIKPGTKNESVHIPVIIGQSGLKEVVYNDFYVGKGADVVIIAGCGIHNCGGGNSRHDGVHSFFIEEGAKVKYVEKHYGEGDGPGKRVMNPQTIVELGKNSEIEMEMVQIEGVDSTDRVTKATLGEGAKLVITERLLTHGEQYARTDIDVKLNGYNSSANIISRSVAKGSSEQLFISKIEGNAKCKGHSECDAIIMDNAVVKALPEVDANCVDAELVHEAAIGKIAGEQIIKLMTLGLSEEEAEKEIVNGFLR